MTSDAGICFLVVAKQARWLFSCYFQKENGPNWQKNHLPLHPKCTTLSSCLELDNNSVDILVHRSFGYATALEKSCRARCRLYVSCVMYSPHDTSCDTAKTCVEISFESIHLEHAYIYLGKDSSMRENTSIYWSCFPINYVLPIHHTRQAFLRLHTAVYREWELERRFLSISVFSRSKQKLFIYWHSWKTSCV